MRVLMLVSVKGRPVEFDKLSEWKLDVYPTKRDKASVEKELKLTYPNIFETHNLVLWRKI